jgi:PAS domain S-box-containing protein
VSVLIHGEQHPFGVLCAHTVKRRQFSSNDVHFLQTVANILATANQRNRAEEALRLRDRAIAAASEGILITDPRQPDNPIIYANAGFERLTGYTSAEAIGRNCRFLGGPETDSAAVDQMCRAVRVGRECTVEVMNYRKDGATFWNRVSISPVRDACGRLTHFVGVLTDITERKKVERMKREFISTVSHELRTPLTSICGALGLVRGDVVGELPVQAKGLVEIAYRNSERLVRLVNDILDIDRLEDGRMAFQPRPVALLPLVETAIELNHAYAESLRVGLVLHQALLGAMAHVDPDRIVQVLTNLLSNAAKFSPPEGTVSISMARCGNYIRLAVADQGPGIPDEFRDRIFDRFAQADTSDSRQRGGTGLGLHIAKAIVEESGGNIGFESRIGGGTLFYCDLPEWKGGRQD